MKFSQSGVGRGELLFLEGRGGPGAGENCYFLNVGEGRGPGNCYFLKAFINLKIRNAKSVVYS